MPRFVAQRHEWPRSVAIRRAAQRLAAAVPAGDNPASTIQQEDGAPRRVRTSHDDDEAAGLLPPDAAGGKAKKGKKGEKGEEAKEAAKAGARAAAEMWHVVPKVVLRVGALRPRAGRLTVVVGPTGCGKTSLLRSLINAQELRSGRVAVGGSIAYVQQDAWLLNATLRDNVTFHKPRPQPGGAAEAEAEAEALYHAAVDATQLRGDLPQLRDGDRTERPSRRARTPLPFLTRPRTLRPAARRPPAAPAPPPRGGGAAPR
eukprot:gene4982-5734_t